MYQFSYTYRVCYADTDQMGFMYYGHYARLYEIGRVEALRSLGLPYIELEQSGIMMPVLENHSKFLLPAKYDEQIQILVSIKEIPKVRMTFYYEIKNRDGKTIHEGESVLAFVNSTSQKPVRCPAKILEALEPHF